MTKTTKEYITRFKSLKTHFKHLEKDGEFNDGCNCAIDCIHDGIDTRIDILMDFDDDDICSINSISDLYDESIDTLIKSLKECIKTDNSLFSQGFNKIVNDFFRIVKQ